MRNTKVEKGERTIEVEAKQPRDFTIAYWYDNKQEMPDHEQEHVIEVLEQGYVEGELCDGDRARGWWRILSEVKAR